MDSVGHDNYPAHTQLLANIHRMFVSNSAWSKVYGHGPTLHKHAGSQSWSQKHPAAWTGSDYSSDWVHWQRFLL